MPARVRGTGSGWQASCDEPDCRWLDTYSHHRPEAQQIADEHNEAAHGKAPRRRPLKGRCGCGTPGCDP